MQLSILFCKLHPQNSEIHAKKTAPRGAPPVRAAALAPTSLTYPRRHTLAEISPRYSRDYESCPEARRSAGSKAPLERWRRDCICEQALPVGQALLEALAPTKSFHRMRIAAQLKRAAGEGTSRGASSS